MSAHVINFSDLDDSNGFILNRISSLRCSGYSVSPPGNVDGDTHDNRAGTGRAGCCSGAPLVERRFQPDFE